MTPAQGEVALGDWSYDHQEWTHAMEHYNRAISLGMDTANIRTDLGSAYRFSGEPMKALEQYQIAQKLDPQHEYSCVNTATLYADVLKDPLNAATAWREYLRRFPNGEKVAAAREYLEGTASKMGDAGQMPAKPGVPAMP